MMLASWIGTDLAKLFIMDVFLQNTKLSYAVRILGEFVSRLRSEIRSFEFELLPMEEQIRLKVHHDYHGDRQVEIVGALPQKTVFVRAVDHIGYRDSVIDVLCYKNDCFEDCFIRNATERREINFIKKWLKNNLPEDELAKLIAEGKILCS